MDEKIIHVGKTQKPGKNRSSVTHNYHDVVYDIYGWADPAKYLPLNYDLCLLKTKYRNVYGWFTGTDWEGLRLKDDMKVIAWKRSD